MELHDALEEENCSSKRSRYNPLHGDQNVGAADQSDSMFKVGKGDFEITAERMAEGSSHNNNKSSDNNNNNIGCILELDPPLSFRTEASKGAVNQISLAVTKTFQGTYLDSGLHKSNVEVSQAGYRSERLGSSSFEPVCEEDLDWLALGLNCGYGSGQSKHFFNKSDLDIAKHIKLASIISWNEHKSKDDHRQQPPQMLNVGHTTNSTIPLAPSSTTIQTHQFTLPNIINSISGSLPKANNFSLQENISDSSNFSALKLIQFCTLQDRQRPTDVAMFPSTEQLNFNFQPQQTRVTSLQSQERTQWQGFSEATDLLISERRMSTPYEDSHSLFEGWESVISTTVASPPHQNSVTDARSYAVFKEAGTLQQGTSEKMPCRTQRSTKYNFPSWCNPESNLDWCIRPSASETALREISLPDSTLLFTHPQYVDRTALSASNCGMSCELQRIPGDSWMKNGKILRPRKDSQTGVWFALQPLNEQNGDRMLPQIPKNYLRIKDRTMTIRLLKKYLANKLGLNSDSEIEIMCRGEQLFPWLTLQHVRDVMWSSQLKDDNEISNYNHSYSHSSINHIMVLHYQRNSA